MPNWRSLLRTAVRLTIWLTWLLARLGLFLALRLGPPLWRGAVALTDRTLALLDDPLGGRIARRPAVTLLCAGGLWLLLGLLLSGLRYLIGGAPVSLLFLALAFAWGLACGRAVRQQPDWGTWAIRNGLQLGETIP